LCIKETILTWRARCALIATVFGVGGFLIKGE